MSRLSAVLSATLLLSLFALVVSSAGCVESDSAASPSDDPAAAKVVQDVVVPPGETEDYLIVDSAELGEISMFYGGFLPGTVMLGYLDPAARDGLFLSKPEGVAVFATQDLDPGLVDYLLVSRDAKPECKCDCSQLSCSADCMPKYFSGGCPNSNDCPENSCKCQCVYKATGAKCEEPAAVDCQPKL